MRYLAVNYNKQNNITAQSTERLLDDIPDYAKAGNINPYQEHRKNPFGHPEPDDTMDLTTDAINEDGWVR